MVGGARNWETSPVDYDVTLSNLDYTALDYDVTLSDLNNTAFELYHQFLKIYNFLMGLMSLS